MHKQTLLYNRTAIFAVPHGSTLTRHYAHDCALLAARDAIVALDDHLVESVLGKHVRVRRIGIAAVTRASPVLAETRSTNYQRSVTVVR
jgi:hypothetical protein